MLSPNFKYSAQFIIETLSTIKDPLDINITLRFENGRVLPET